MTNQESLKNLFDDTFENNSYNVNFKLDLFNSKDIKLYDVDDEGNKVRFVPTMINDVVGEYLNIPNANSTSNETSLIFELLTDYDGEYNDNITSELEQVSYTNTLNAIEEFKASLLAKYHPLGTPYLYMGGEDSSFVVEYSANVDVEYIKLTFTPKNTDSESILAFGGTSITTLVKDATDITFAISTAISLSVPYTVNEEITITLSKDASNLWTMTDGTNTDSDTTANVVNTTKVTVGQGDGLECIFKYLEFASSSIAEEVVIDTWNSKDTITNSGTKTLIDDTISNCILWSEDGNAVFGFGTLSPLTDQRALDGQFIYQAFELPITVFISNDVLFGNNFEYYLDGLQIYPIDRQHTLGTELGSAQYIESNENEHIVEESSRDHTLSFYYIPSKKLNSLLKHIVSGSTAQNTTYTLLVQYPFFQVSYDVLLDTGGTQPNINTISTFTLTFKKSDSSL